MHDPVSTVRQCYSEFGRGNAAGVLELLHPDVVWVDPGYPEIPYAGKRKGKTEVAAFFAQMGEQMHFTRFEPQVFLRDGGTVVVRGFFAGRGAATGKTCETEWVMIWTVAEGLIKEYQAYIDTYRVAKEFS